MCPSWGWVSRGPLRPGTGPERHRGTAPDAPGPGRLTAQPAGPSGGFPGRSRAYLIQASTLSRLASTHFFAAASGVILSTAMYLATVFWSSFVQLNFFTRS